MAYNPKSNRSSKPYLTQKKSVFDGLTANKNIDDIRELAKIVNGHSDEIISINKDITSIQSEIDVINSLIDKLQKEKQNNITLTTTGSSGPATLVNDVLNIPQYSGGSGSTTWGSITGTLSDQTDLQSELNAKFDDPTGTSSDYLDGTGTPTPFPTIPSTSGLVPYTGATSNVDLGEYQIKAGQVEFDQTPTGTTGVAKLRWNDTDGTLDLGLKGGNVTLQIGQESVKRIVNKTSPLITLLEANYQAVVVSGATGQRLSVRLAKADSDANSAGTIGIVTETILPNQEGFITTSGEIHEINTTGSLQGETWADGDILYLSPTTFGGITNVKPSAPQHLIVVGYVEYSHAIHGKIFVKIDNGYELDELHNVAISSVADNDLIQYDSATSLWKNRSLASAGVQPSLGYTPAPNTRTISTTSPLSGGGDLSADRTISISQATTSTSGYLSSTDWNTFNGKQAALGYTPEDVSNKSISVSTDKLSDTKYPSVKSVYDWATGLFATTTQLATKQDALTLTTTGTSGAATLVGSTLNIPQYSGGSSAAWGSITGTLSSQTDLQTALNAKQDTLVSGTNIKTLNGFSIVGSGNLNTPIGSNGIIKPQTGSYLHTGVVSTGTTTMPSIVGTTNRLYLYPFISSQDISISAININVTSAVAGSLARIVMYTSGTTNGGDYPNLKAFESTSLDCSTTGIKSASNIMTLEKGRIWWIGVHSSAAGQFLSMLGAQMLPINFTGSNTANSNIIQTATFGSLPSSYGSGTLTNANCPYVFFTI